MNAKQPLDRIDTVEQTGRKCKAGILPPMPYRDIEKGKNIIQKNGKGPLEGPFFVGY